MSDTTDFMAAHPVSQPPAAPVERDSAMEAFVATRQFATHTPFGGRRSMRLVDPTVCRVDLDNPCDHDHSSPVFTPDPALDETHVGWTAQHIPRKVDGYKVAMHCVLCWKLESELALHDCPVGVLVYG